MSEATAVDSLNVQRVRATIEEHFPGLWPAVDTGLAVCATLLLKDNVNPVAVIYVGGPSSSKTTVADLFTGHPLSYRSDNFTPAAFVSHAANVPKDKLATVDLLPRIRHRVFVTPELAPIFRGKEDDLANRFAIITRVLDGQGLITDSGTHGQRGYTGDYLFAWLGCTTPFDEKAWRVMAQLGSRLFFLVMDSNEEVTVDDLLRAGTGISYSERLEVLRSVVHPFLTDLFARHDGIRGVDWNLPADPSDVRTWIARLATLLVAMRSEPVKDDPDAGSYSPAKVEAPWRAHSVLLNLARGHALVHGRSQLSEDDLPVVARVALASMPTSASRVCTALVREGRLTTAQVQAVLGAKHHDTAIMVMRDLEWRGLVNVLTDGPGFVAVFRQEWDWCSSPEFGRYVFGGPVKHPGVCAESVICNLVQRQEEEGVEETGSMRDTHPPQEMTAGPLVLSAHG